MTYNFNIEQIKQDIENVLKYSQGWQNLQLNGIDAILNKWLDNKKYFIEKMGGNLIYELETPVQFELDEKAKQDKINNFIDLLCDHYNNSSMADFICHLKITDFYENKTSSEYIVFTDEEQKIVIPKNFKVVKALKFFEKDINILKEIQNEASRIIQENIISGYLGFSVHPLDYLSLSENVHNWRSCHALDGDYRSGNLNYMVDSTTVICYLRAEKKAILPHFPESIPWFSKKWRVLLFFSNDKTLMFAGRPYPFSTEKGLTMIKNLLLPQLNLGSWSLWNNTTIQEIRDEMSGTLQRFKAMMPIGTTLKQFDKVVLDMPQTYQFNDLLRSSVYHPIWSYKLLKNGWRSYGGNGANDETQVIVGDACPCPICGRNNVAYSEIMLCPDCAENFGQEEIDDYYECEICGTMTHADDLYYLEFSNLRVCPNCYQRETFRCQECGAVDTSEQIKYREGSNCCLCPACWENARNKRKRFTSIEEIPIYF